MAHVKQPQAVAENEERKLRTRRRLMEAAIDVISENGYSGCQIRDIVRSAGVSIGTFYFYFTDKREIFEKVLEENNDVLRTYLDERAVEMGVSDLETGLRAYYRGYVDFVLTHRKLFLCWFRSGAHLERGFGEFVERIGREAFLDTRRRLQVGVDFGVSRRDLDLDVVSYAVVAMLVEVAHRCLLGDLAPETAVESLVSFTLRGLQARP